MALDRNIGLAGVHAGPAARKPADFVAHRILNSERYEIETGKRTLDGRDIYPDGATRIKPRSPRQGVGGSIDVVFIAVRGASHLPQNPARNAAFQIHPVGEPEITAELDAAADDMNLFRLELPQLLGQDLLETARTRSKESFHARCAAPDLGSSCSSRSNRSSGSNSQKRFETLD